MLSSHIRVLQKKIENKDQFLVYSDLKIKDRKTQKSQIQRVYLVPELLLPTGLTDQMRKNRQSMKDLARFTQIKPAIRDKAHHKIIEQLNTKENELGISLDPNSNEIDTGLIFKPPQIELEEKFI